MTKTQLFNRASVLALGLDTWSPGDGVTRYRFYRDAARDYFSSDPLATLLGLGEASIWLEGYAAGLGAVRCLARTESGRCRQPFRLLSGEVQGCPVHGIREGA